MPEMKTKPCSRCGGELQTEVPTEKESYYVEGIAHYVNNPYVQTAAATAKIASAIKGFFYRCNKCGRLSVFGW